MKYCILEHRTDGTTVIGPFNSAQEAAEWANTKYTPQRGSSAVVAPMISPELFGPDGTRPR